MEYEKLKDLTGSLKAIIFDLDGTLVDTLEDVSESMNYILEGEGMMPKSRNHYRSLIGLGTYNMVRKTVTTTEHVSIEGLHRQFITKYRENLVNHSSLYPDVETTLTALQNTRVPIAVLSNKSQDMINVILDSLFTNQVFVSVLGFRDGVKKKPDATQALKIIEEMGVSSTKVGFVGDTTVDMKTAVNAGLVPIGVSWGYGEVDALLESGAEHIIDRPTQLLNYVDCR